MSNYIFDMLDDKREELLDYKSLLRKRPFLSYNTSFKQEAKYYVPGEALQTAINVTIAVGDPLLITGEPGTGKTLAAYYTAYKLSLEIYHFQVKSDSTYHDLFYHYDMIRYFRESHLCKEGETIDKEDYIDRCPLYEALTVEAPCVLLIDEIDKAPRDFPNDLLLALDKMCFEIPETKKIIKAEPEKRPIVFITSNNERRLPEPFLRRCVYHNIVFTRELLVEILNKHRHRYATLSKGIVDLAVNRFLDLREEPLRKKPSTNELLVWLDVLALYISNNPEKKKELEEKLLKLSADFPYPGVLLKDKQDVEHLIKI